jgi:hypothetical protein
MKVRINIHDICTQAQIDDFIKYNTSLQDIVTCNYTKLSDGTYDTFLCVTYNKCSMLKYLALKKYANKKKDKVEVIKL